MKKTFSITMEITPLNLNILLKSLEHFRNCSNFFDNGEYSVEAEELEDLILRGVKGVTTTETQLS